MVYLIVWEYFNFVNSFRLILQDKNKKDNQFVGTGYKKSLIMNKFKKGKTKIMKKNV